MAIGKRSGLFGCFLCTFFLLLASTLGHAQCTGTGTITCTVTQSVSISSGSGTAGPSGNLFQEASVYPSTLTISLQSGTIATVSVQLHGLTSNATGNGVGTNDLELLLEAPNGSYMELMGNAGIGANTSGTNLEDWSNGGVTLTIQDGATMMPDYGASPCSTSTTAGWPHAVESGGFDEGTFAPTSCPFGSAADFYPSPGPGAVSTSSDLAAPTGTATLNGTFGNHGLSPDGTWNLYLVDTNAAFASNDSLSISGWSLIFTLNAAATSTSTTLTSNPNPSFTSGANSSVTLTATVTGTSTVNAGTVTFKDGANAITCAGGNPATVSNGQANCVTTFSTQGNHSLTADYSGSSSFNGSNSPTLNQFVETPTTTSSGAYCNAGGITMPGQDNTSPYPSVVNVPSTVTNAVATVSLTLSGFSFAQAADVVHMLLVSPDNKALEFFSAGDGASSGTYNFSDTGASGQPNNGSAQLSPGSYIPAVYTTGDVFTPSPSVFAPQVPNTFKVALPVGGANAGTFESTFNGATASGAWSLFVYDGAGTNANGAITGGWCLNITQAVGLATTTTVALTPHNPSLTGESVTVTATVRSGGNPVTSGAVSFTENGQNIAGPLPLNSSGQASFSTTALLEGDHNILATYNDSTNTYALSFGNKIQRVDSSTVFSQNANVLSYCNPGTITIPSAPAPNDEGEASPNPSNIFVTNAPGTINHVTVTLNGVKLSTPYYLTSLLVGPLNTTADSLDFFSDVGGSSPMSAGVNVTLSDGAASNLSTGNALTSGSFKPTSGKGNDSFFPSADGFYTPPLSSGFAANYAAPAGFSTLASTFASQNPNGIWSLYLNQDNFATGSSISSWCVNLTETQPTSHSRQAPLGQFLAGTAGRAVYRGHYQ